ncbi:hypothetical protein ABZ468_48845 [Streptomyces sp. NPDC005708]|uniref:hypothetical protein n=1 Tax=Streptomyces sp. NPDC005708 TaxID=3154564 RepID=UPI0033C7F3A3
MNPQDPNLPERVLVVTLGASGAGKTTLTATWPASQVLFLDALRGAVSDLFGIHPNTAYAWAQYAQTSWAEYLEALRE